MPKPTTVLQWATSPIVISGVSGKNHRETPAASKITDGWDFNEKPPRQDMNFLFNLAGEWIEFFDSVIDQDVTVAASPQFVDLTLTGFLTTAGPLTVTTGGVIVSAGFLTVAGPLSVTTGDITVSAGEIIVVTTGDIRTNMGDVSSASGNLEAILGDVIAGNKVIGKSSGIGIEATLGDVQATVGDIIATVGNVTAGNNITANVDVVATTGNVQATAGDIIAGVKVQTDEISEKTGSAGIKMNNPVGINATPTSSQKLLIESTSGTNGLHLGLTDAPAAANSPRLIHDSSKHATSNRIYHWRMETEELHLRVTEPDFSSNLKSIFKMTSLGKVGINHEADDLNPNPGGLFVKDGIRSGGIFVNSAIKWKVFTGVITSPGPTNIAHTIPSPLTNIISVTANIRDAGSLFHCQDNGGAAAGNNYTVKYDATNIILDDFGANLTNGLPFKVFIIFI